MMPGLGVCLCNVGSLKSKKFKAGELLWVVHTFILGRQSLLGVEGSRAVFCSTVLSVCDEKASSFLNNRLKKSSDLQPLNMLMLK